MTPRPQLGDQILQVHRLGDEAVDAGREGLPALVGEDAGGKGDDRQVRQAELPANGAGGRQPIHHRHLDIHQHGIVTPGVLAQTFQCLPTVGGQGRPRPLPGQDLGDNLQVPVMVVHHQDPQTRQTWPLGMGGGGDRRGRLFRFVRLAGEADLEPEGAADALGALPAEGAAHQVHQLAGDGQAEPGATEAAGDGAIRLGEGGAQMSEVLRGDPEARVADQKLQPDSLRRQFPLENAQADLAAFGEFDGIADQVGQDLFEAQGVAQQPRDQIPRGLDPEIQPLGPGHAAHEYLQVGEEALEHEGLEFQTHLAPLDLGQIQDVVEEGQEGAPGGADVANLGPLSRSKPLLFEQLRHAKDRVHGGADLVAHVGEELALGEVGGLGLLLGLQQGAFSLHPRADVSQQPQEAGGLALGIPHQGQRYLGMGQGSIRAAVALFDDGAAFSPQQSGEQGLLQGPVLGRGEVTQMPAQKGLPGVADDLAITVVDVDQVTLQAHLGDPRQALGDEGPNPLLAGLSGGGLPRGNQFLLLAQAFGDVAGDTA